MSRIMYDLYKLMYIHLLITILLIGQSDALDSQQKTKIWKSKSQTYVGRLHPGQDIMQTLTELLSHEKHNAITISSATGSVLHCHIRFANQSYLTKVNGPLQITSITGTFDKNLKPHLHIAVADGTGHAFGGHLPSLQERSNKEGNLIGYDCPIFTTLQLALMIHQDVNFQRKLDPETTFDQLSIIPHLYPFRPRLGQQKVELSQQFYN